MKKLILLLIVICSFFASTSYSQSILIFKIDLSSQESVKKYTIINSVTVAIDDSLSQEYYNLGVKIGTKNISALHKPGLFERIEDLQFSIESKNNNDNKTKYYFYDCWIAFFGHPSFSSFDVLNCKITGYDGKVYRIFEGTEDDLPIKKTTSGLLNDFYFKGEIRDFI